MKKLLGILVLGLGLIFSGSTYAEEKEVVWQVYVKVIGNNQSGYNAKESYTLKKSKNAKKNLIKTVKKALKKCKKDWGLNYKGCAVTVIKYYEPNDPSKNRKLVNTSGINIEDVKVNWDGLVVSKIEKEIQIEREKRIAEEQRIAEEKRIEKKERKKKKKKELQKQKAKDKCKELGFTKGTEDFADCVTIMLSKQ